MVVTLKLLWKSILAAYDLNEGRIPDALKCRYLPSVLHGNKYLPLFKAMFSFRSTELHTHDSLDSTTTASTYHLPSDPVLSETRLIIESYQEELRKQTWHFTFCLVEQAS